MPNNRTGLLIVRAWLEHGSSKPLRGHIRLTGDIVTGFEREVTLVEVAGICAEVETWLLEMLASDQEP
jgi:hypothetical protein